MCADRTFEIEMAQDIDLPSYTELALEIMDGRSSGLWRCGYYFADPSNRSEWEAFTLYSMAILNANIAFLAVPNVNPTALP